ncbi:PREDICTED: ADP-ribosylation factor-binding protein GGA1 [Thamnophis sirtalis]|uniref:ADP-ribosylation factor-binding protein GGA1 n=1 Tax=Thamnophis sirtalis TaxID=35019 RepID=A0A6I9Y8I8_9SAUR|nr:PREDICTED: ADP-ribosylation factor-binding protein GGA1 [Thamnophis sirtalis]
MEAEMEAETLESRINRATNPLNKDLEWDNINAFCDQLNKELEGPPLATRLLAHKIQSPQEWEAMQALTVLEACMKNCGKRFHDEVGKFRFLNELIKVVSPKYLGNRTPEKVKSKILELMYSWTLGLPEEVKITEAYQMLKKQGIVKCDPKLPDDAPFLLPPPRPKNAIFDDEEKSKMLARLLKSSHPEDLRAANKLIKEMVQEDQKRMEKISKRVHAIEEVNNNVKLLTDMVTNYSNGERTESSEDLMKELYQRCERMRPMLFRLASDTEDNDEALGIVKCDPKLPDDAPFLLPPPRPKNAIFDDEEKSKMLARLLKSSHPEDLRAANKLIKEMVQEDTSIQFGCVFVGSCIKFSSSFFLKSSESPEMDVPSGLPAPIGKAETGQPASPVATSGMDDLDLLGKTLLQQSLPPESLQVRWEKQPPPRLTLRDLQNKSTSSPSLSTNSTSSIFPNISSNPAVTLPIEKTPPVLAPQGSPTLSGSASLPAGLPASTHPLEFSLTNVSVPLESIKPSSILPVTVYDQHGFRVLFHFAKDSLPDRPDVLVVVISMLSTAPLPIRNIIFQSAVPKVMKVKLQPPSGTELPPFNPIMPPTAITQVLLLANPQKEKVRLRYKLTFTMADQTYNEMGDVDQFPPPESWGNL